VIAHPNEWATLTNDAKLIGQQERILCQVKIDTSIAVRVKLETAKHFQKFPKTHFKSHTEAMPSHVGFFYFDYLLITFPSNVSFGRILKRKTDAIVSII